MVFSEEPGLALRPSTARAHPSLSFMGSVAINLKGTDKAGTLLNKIPTKMTNTQTGVACLYLVTAQL